MVQQRLRDYIFAVVQHYPNIYAWDVVNEVATDTPNAANPYRTDSPWYIAYSVGGADGREYVRDAFMFANEARASIGRNSANMKLMLNDYNTELPGKRANVHRGSCRTSSTPVDSHRRGRPPVPPATQCRCRPGHRGVGGGRGLSSTLVNHVTELDVSIYADPGNCFSLRTIPPCMADYGANPPQACCRSRRRCTARCSTRSTGRASRRSPPGASPTITPGSTPFR